MPALTGVCPSESHVAKRIDWTGVSYVCDDCVPNIEAKFSTCNQYCAAQHGMKCVAADLTYPESCNTQKSSTCTHSSIAANQPDACDPNVKAQEEVIAQQQICLRPLDGSAAATAGRAPRPAIRAALARS